MLSQINIFFKNYKDLIYYCEKFTQISWFFFDKDEHKRICCRFEMDFDCNSIIPWLEESFLEGDTTENQKLFNLIDFKLKEIEGMLEKINFIISNEQLSEKSLNFVRTECGSLILFLLHFLDLSHKEHMNFNLGIFYNALLRTFYRDKKNLQSLFTLKSLNIDSNDNKNVQNQQLYTNNSKTKIKWSGTPGEFGAIFNELFDQGYIERVNDKKTMVKVLNEIFDIKNEKSAPVDETYLYKCFGEKERNYLPEKLIIPLSDNYHKKK